MDTEPICFACYKGNEFIRNYVMLKQQKHNNNDIKLNEIPVVN